MVSEEEVVETAARAAEDVIFEAYDHKDVTDIDVSVRFVNDELTIEVYLDAGAVNEEEEEREAAVVDEAIEAARSTVDELQAVD